MQIKTLINAAMMIAIYLVLLILYNMGLFSFFITLVLPVPLIVFCVKSQKTQEIFLMYLGCLVGAYIVGSILGVITTLIFGLSGIILGIGLIKKRPYWQRLFNSSLVYVIGLPIMAYLISGIDMAASLTEMLNESIAMAETVMPTMDFSEASLVFTRIITQLLPTVLLLSGLLTSFLSDKLAVLIIKRLKLMNVPMTNWENYQLGTFLAAIYIISQLLLGLGIHPAFYTVLINMSLLLNILFAVQGFIVVNFFIKVKFNRSLGAIIAIVMFISGLSMVFSMIGVMDALFNYRNRFLIKGEG